MEFNPISIKSDNNFRESHSKEVILIGKFNKKGLKTQRLFFMGGG